MRRTCLDCGRVKLKVDKRSLCELKHSIGFKYSMLDSTAVSIFVDILVELTNSVVVISTNMSTYWYGSALYSMRWCLWQCYWHWKFENKCGQVKVDAICRNSWFFCFWWTTLRKHGGGALWSASKPCWMWFGHKFRKISLVLVCGSKDRLPRIKFRLDLVNGNW